MRLFVSYARVDKPYCIQIIDTLDVHEVWYDQRLYAGQNWWREILRRLDWCEGFIYLLSPESVASEYCQREFRLAQSLGRHIFPVLVHQDTDIPESIRDIQYADLSRGLTVDAVKVLLNAIYVSESKRRQQAVSSDIEAISVDQIKPPITDPAAVISHAATAMEDGQFDQAVFLLRQAKEGGYTSKFINIDAILAQAESALEKQTSLREAEREYRQIASLVRHYATFPLGCKAFEAFQATYPEYDPDGIAVYCSTGLVPSTEPKASELLPMLQWCDVSSAKVVFQYADAESKPRTKRFNVEEFKISKYPITNAQYQVFLEDADGYANLEWWAFSEDAVKTRLKKPKAQAPSFKGALRPREMVNWYDAMAFCRWLSRRAGKTVTLPTLAQWQRAYQGDDERCYPWGNEFDKSYCNTAESELKMTTLVNGYPQNASPFGVCDMAGNVWEWCLNGCHEDKFAIDAHLTGKRYVRGGAFISPGKRARIDSHYCLNPQVYYSSIGFRIVMVDS